MWEGGSFLQSICYLPLAELEGLFSVIPFGKLYVSVTFMLYLLVIHMFGRFTVKVILTPPAVDKLELSMH